MRIDIQPYWKKLADWYWEQAGGHAGLGMSIWEMLEHEYGARKVYHGPQGGKYGAKNNMIVEFSDEKMYTLFALRWS